MGLMSFVKSAGEMLGIGGEEESPEATALKEQLSGLGLEADGLDVEVEGDTVKVSGETSSQEAKEKLLLALGNVAGIAQVDDDITAKIGGPESSYYTVEKGDSLWKIADTHYGDGSKYTEIFEANKPMLKDPDKIYPGQMLRIPPQTASA